MHTGERSLASAQSEHLSITSRFEVSCSRAFSNRFRMPRSHPSAYTFQLQVAFCVLRRVPPLTAVSWHVRGSLGNAPRTLDSVATEAWSRIWEAAQSCCQTASWLECPLCSRARPHRPTSLRKDPRLIQLQGRQYPGEPRPPSISFSCRQRCAAARQSRADLLSASRRGKRDWTAQSPS